MFMTSVLGHAYALKEKAQPVAIIWKLEDRGHGDCWDFFCLASPEEAEMRVHMDSVLTGLDRSHYEVKQG